MSITAEFRPFINRSSHELIQRILRLELALGDVQQAVQHIEGVIANAEIDGHDMAVLKDATRRARQAIDQQHTGFPSVGADGPPTARAPWQDDARSAAGRDPSTSPPAGARSADPLDDETKHPRPVRAAGGAWAPHGG